MKRAPLSRHLLLILTLIFLFSALPLSAEVMLQWFETEWDEMYRRLPAAAEIGYDYLWIPPPTKAPTGLGTKWGNVGYSLYDRFDLGDVPQRGSYATRYGTRGSLINMVRNAHQCDIKIIPDIVMNHNGNGPDIRYYPGMRPEDFHVQWEANHANDLNYKRGPRMTQWSPDNGYGGTMWEDLASLIDIRTEDIYTVSDPKRFTGGSNTPGWNFVDGVSYLRHPGMYDRYPFYPSGYGNENSAEMLFRWIAWLGDTMDYDGLRLDAGKHTPYEFFGWRGSGFLHEAQWNYNQRHGYSDSNANEADELFTNYLAERDDALIFAEILSYQSELNYWFGDMSLPGTAGNTRNPMRFLDYPIKQIAYEAFGGNLARLSLGGGAIDPQVGIMYVWGHDEGPPDKVNLAYAYTLTHVGMPMVYFTGNNISWDDYGRTANDKTWMIPGYDGQALGDSGNDIPNLVWVHQNFTRGREWERWADGDYLAYERYDDINSDEDPDSGEAVAIIALNDSGGDITHTLATSFPDGTVLKDYTGHSGTTPTVSGGNVSIHVPGNGGQGWAVYAPQNADDLHMVFKQGVSPVPTMSWIVPGGIHGSDKPRQIPRITSTSFRVEAGFNPLGGTVDSAMLKWGQGRAKLTATNYFSTGYDVVSGRYEKMNQINSTNWYMDITINSTNISEGLNVVKVRAFNSRPAGQAALFSTAPKVVYVDTKGPEIDIAHPAAGSTVYGDAVMIISNKDFTAYGMNISVDGAAGETAHEVMKGLWKYCLRNLSSGAHTVTVTTTEADWGNPRTVINTSVYTRAFSVVPNASTIGLSHSHGSEIQIPFFTTSVNAPGASDVRLYWNGYRLPFNAGGADNIFDGTVIYEKDPANVVTDRLWGAFVNGPNFFEAVRVDGGVTNRAVARVTLNLYGINAIDSDGDSIPDNVEMPFIDSDGAPGADQPWPGDSNKDFIPNYGESWQKLNPYNHSTFYSGQWDDQQDWDGDGYSNGDEVDAGYNEGNIYKYNIYDGNSTPTSGTPFVSSAAKWTPSFGVRGSNLQITYSPNGGALSNVAQVVCHIGHSAKTLGSWQDVIDTNMTASSTNWVLNYLVPTNATSVDFVFFDGGSVWDANNGNDWQAPVQGVTNFSFTIDGTLDSQNYLIHPDGMRIHAAVSGTRLYVATWAVGESSGNNDHFIYVTDELGDVRDAVPGWGKNAGVFMDTSVKPILAAEGENDWESWLNVSGSAQNDPGAGNTLEGEIDLTDAFGYMPDVVYIAAVSISTTNRGVINSQGPYEWMGGYWDQSTEPWTWVAPRIDPVEFLRVPVESIRDEDIDGYFDSGKPQMWTVVNGNTNDANYGLRRTFLNELAGDSTDITVILQPNLDPGDSISDVELFSNINRRDFAAIEEDPLTVTTQSKSTYYRAYPMQNIGGGRYAYTISVKKCGAYRINARYKVNGGSYVYYTDSGLRRDCAVVASPKKALELRMYELNPMTAEATAPTFAGRSTFADMVTVNGDRPDRINKDHFTSLGINMIWLQPIHPIGSDNRQTDPDTGSPYDPGSPYAVRSYWDVNPVLGDPSTRSQALTEFQTFVSELDGAGVGVMLDGTFNHSAWDCEVGQPAVDMFSWATNATDFIRKVKPAWYSKQNNYNLPATYYQSLNSTDIAPAPDRIDFGKWNDAADFHFGTYDALVQSGASGTNAARSSQWYDQYLMEHDHLETPLSQSVKDLWEYFAYYPIYWLEKTGHPAGTPKDQSYKGIDGLRCDFAQGLPSKFWEYTINRTRSVKWDFLYMAESLDGYREINGSKRHGVGYRSSRHFDILNENMIYFWRDQFFDYFNGATNAVPETWKIFDAFNDRRNAFDVSPILLNLSSHDDVYPSDDPYRTMYAYASVAAMDGAPMMLYGQEAGALNDPANYPSVPNSDHNFAKYEINFNKSIPNFKRYNSMGDVWTNRDWNLQHIYARINNARKTSAALQDQNNYFLSRTNSAGWDNDMLAIAKFEQAGVDAATQDVVFVFVNNNFWESTNRWATFDVDAEVSPGVNWFGIKSGNTYNLRNLIATNPTANVWSSDKTGAEIFAQGITVGLTGNPYNGDQAQYLKLVDVNAVYPDADSDGIPDYSDWDDDNDGLSDTYETDNGLNPKVGTGNDGGDGDKDGDGVSNRDEMFSGTSASNILDFLAAEISIAPGGMKVMWDSKEDINYHLERSPSMKQQTWQSLYFGTAISNREAVVDSGAQMNTVTSRFYRIRAKP
ncbi:MAG: hypothetical protein KJ626_03415 [Verrucomicrobia bacterium]|nr:hypothetical protein [Verrucomicrobiota bacterium]